MKSRLPLIVFLFCCAVFLALFSSLPHAIWHPAVVLGWFVSKGLVFYRDFTNQHFPLATFLALPFLWMSSWNLQVEPFLSLIIAVTTLFVLFKISTKLFSWVGTAASLAFFSLLFYYFSTYIQYSMEAVIGLFLAALLLSFVNQPNKPTGANTFGKGLLTGLTAITGQIVALPLLVMCIALLRQLWSGAKRSKSILLTWFLIGGLLPLLTLSAYLIKNQAFADFFETNVIYYLTYVKLAREASKISDLPWPDIALFYTPLLPSLALIVKNHVAQKTQNILGVVSLVSLASIPSVVFSIFHPHHFLHVLPAMALLFGFVFESTLTASKAWIKIIAVAAVMFDIWLLSIKVLPWYTTQIKSSKPHIINDVLPNDPMYDAVSWINTNTSPESRILVAGDMLFYFKADRLPSANRQTVLPWHYKPIEQAASIVRNSRPVYWIIDTNYLKRLASPDQWNSPEINEFITEELKTCYQQETTFSNWQIWKKTGC